MIVLRRAMLDASPYPSECIDALIAAIDINDRIDLNVPAPTTVSVDYPANRLIEGFRLSRQLWWQEVDRRSLVALAGRVRGGGSLDEVERGRLKEMRACFKHLRFAFYLYSSRHRSPALLSLVTLIMGELQDAMRVARPGDARRRASQLRLLLTTPVWRLLTHEIDRLTPSDTASFRRFTHSQVASLRSLLAAPTVTAHAFHAARKVVSRQVSFHDDMRVLYGDGDHVGTACWLATLNGLMGAAHDELVARRAAGGFDYKREGFALSADIRERLEVLVELYLGTSSSAPPSA